MADRQRDDEEQTQEQTGSGERPGERIEEQVIVQGELKKQRSGKTSSGVGPKIPFAFRPIRTILFLGILVLILLYFILLFGLGGGGGKTLPGSGDRMLGKAKNEPAAPSASMSNAPPDEATPPDKASLPSVRRELTISFLPSESDPTIAQEGTCLVQWPNVPTPTRIAKENKADFELALEQEIGRWWKTLLADTTENSIPVVAVRMTPFPGEGTFLKIGLIAKSVDERINILRLESSVPSKPAAISAP